MSGEEIFEFMRKNPVFFLATVEGDKPRVRGMLLYKADENGIIFHTGAFKEVHKQLSKNQNVELCFFGEGLQVRIRGKIEKVEDRKLTDEIYDSPTRGFLRNWLDQGKFEDKYKDFIIFKMSKAIATTWSIEQNFEKNTYINLL